MAAQDSKSWGNNDTKGIFFPTRSFDHTGILCYNAHPVKLPESTGGHLKTGPPKNQYGSVKVQRTCDDSHTQPTTVTPSPFLTFAWSKSALHLTPVAYLNRIDFNIGHQVLGGCSTNGIGDYHPELERGG